MKKKALIVSCMPIPLEPDHIEFFSSSETSDYYQIRHLYNSIHHWQYTRTLLEISKLHHQIVILPENALGSWEINCIDNKVPRLFSKDTLVVIGHHNDGDEEQNCVSVYWDGIRQYRQPKLFPYDYSRERADELCLNKRVVDGKEMPLKELLKVSSNHDPEIFISDFPFGRIMIGICEDTNQGEYRQIAKEANIDIFIMLVQDQELVCDRWYHTAAKALYNDKKINTIIVNSAWLERHCRQHVVRDRGVKSPNDPIDVMMIYSGKKKEQTKFTSWDPKNGELWVSGELTI